MKIKNRLLALLCIIHWSCNGNNIDSYYEKDKLFFASDNYKIILSLDKDYKTYYTTFNDQKHGFQFQFNLKNQILNKSIFFADTLLQKKEYYWEDDKLKSILYYNYQYTKSDTVYKQSNLNYPADNIFFIIKMKLFYYKDLDYKIELIGNGSIATIPDNHVILSNEEFAKNWNKAIVAEKYLFIENDDKPADSHKICYTQSFGLLIDNGKGEIVLKKQIINYFVPLILTDSNLVNKLNLIEITF